jgi:outer membrane protein assembly factor BamB
MQMSRILLFSCLALSWTFALASGADWSRFHGPNGSGVAEGTLPTIDPKNPLWKVAIPGQSAGSPIVIAGKVFVQTASKDGKSRTLLCLNAADGTKIWSKDLPGTKATIHTKNSFASSTPASDGETVYCTWWDGSGVTLHAYDMKGNEKWHESLGGYVSQHGPGMSPVLHEGLVFVNVDDDERAELVAFDAKTGDKKWQMPRKFYRASYSTPCILKRENKPAELLLGTTTAITSYEPATGKINWNYEIPWPVGKMPLRVIGNPVYASGLIVMSCGDGGGSRYMVAINPDGKNPAMVWELDKETPYVPCILVKGDLLFWVADKQGICCCGEAKTGKVLWSERLFGKEVTSSPIMVGDDIMAIGEDGDVFVFKASKKFEAVAKVSLKEPVYASPAVADGKVFIRGTAHLFCFGNKP